MSTETIRLIRDSHLDFHTAPELWLLWRPSQEIYLTAGAKADACYLLSRWPVVNADEDHNLIKERDPRLRIGADLYGGGGGGGGGGGCSGPHAKSRVIQEDRGRVAVWTLLIRMFFGK